MGGGVAPAFFKSINGPCYGAVCFISVTQCKDLFIVERLKKTASKTVAQKSNYDLECACNYTV